MYNSVREITDFVFSCAGAVHLEAHIVKRVLTSFAYYSLFNIKCNTCGIALFYRYNIAMPSKNKLTHILFVFHASAALQVGAYSVRVVLNR